MKNEIIFTLLLTSFIGIQLKGYGRGPTQPGTIQQRGGGATKASAEARYKETYMHMYENAEYATANLTSEQKTKKLRQLKNDVSRDRHLNQDTRQAKLDALADFSDGKPNKFK